MYNVFSIDRRVFCRKIIFVCIQDIIFWAVSAVVTFCFLMVRTNGQIRAFVPVGLLLGFFSVRLSLGRLTERIIRPAKKVVNRLKSIYRKIIEKISAIDITAKKVLFLNLNIKRVMLIKKQKKRKKQNKNTCKKQGDCV